MFGNESRPSILETNILYFVMGIALITIGSRVQAANIYIGLLVTEFFIVLFPILFILKIKGYSIKEHLRLNSISLKQSVFTVLIVIFSYPIAIFLNFVGLLILERFARVIPSAIPIPSSPRQYLIGFLIIALVPGICEELMFRGMVMGSYKDLGKKKAIVYSAILFGVFHFNIQNLLGPIFLGLIFGLISYKTNSSIATIIGHTVNNMIALTIGYIIINRVDQMNTAIADAALPQGNEALIGMLVLGIVAMLFGIVVWNLINNMPSTYEDDEDTTDNYTSKASTTNFKDNRVSMGLIGSIPLLIIIIIFIIVNYKYLFN